VHNPQSDASDTLKKRKNIVITQQQMKAKRKTDALVNFTCCGAAGNKIEMRR